MTTVPPDSSHLTIKRDVPIPHRMARVDVVRVPCGELATNVNQKARLYIRERFVFCVDPCFDGSKKISYLF